MSSCQVGAEMPHAEERERRTMLQAKSRSSIEMMLWGAVCMPNVRDEIISMDRSLFSHEFANMLEHFSSTLEDAKVKPEIVEWFLGNQVSIIGSNNVLESIQSCLLKEKERKALKDLSGELVAAASVGDRDNLVNAMKRCLEKLGEL